MKTAIIRNRCYATDKWELEGNTYEFATFELTPEFLKDLKDAIALSASEYKLAEAEYTQDGKSKFKSTFLGHIYHDPGYITYFKRETLEEFIDLQEFDEAEEAGDSGHIEIIGAKLSEEIMKKCLRLGGTRLEINGTGYFRWQGILLYGGTIFSTDWFYRNSEFLNLDEENSSPTRSLNQTNEPTAAPEASERPAESDSLTQRELAHYGKLSDKLARELTRGLSLAKSAGQRRYLNASIQNAICSKLASSSIRKDTRKKLESTLDWLRN